MDDVPKLPSLPADAIEALFSRFAATGDTSAFAAVYDATAPLLMRVARRIARGRGDAEDLIQATYVTAIERARVFDPARPLLPWLVGILAMHAKNAARRAARATSVGVPVVTVEPNQLEALIDLEERAAVAMAIADLPSPYREILDARRRPVDEGSIHGGRTPVLLRVHFHRALDRVRRLLPHGLLAAFPAFVRSRLERRAIQGLRGRLLTRIQKPGLVSSASLTPLAIGSWLMWKKLVAGVLVLLAGWFVAAKLMLSSPSHDVDAAGRVAEAPQLANDPIPPAETATPTTRDAVPPAAPDHRIHYRGRVLDGATLTPVAGATVDIRTLDSDLNLSDSAPRTDSDGRFDVLSEIIDSNPEVRVISHDYAPLYRQIAFPGRTIALREGIDLGDVRLERGATVHGYAHDISQLPIAGARIYLFDHFSKPRWPHILDAARPVGATDRNGKFTIEHVRSNSDDMHMILALSDRDSGATRITSSAGIDSSKASVCLYPNSPVEIEVLDEQGKPISGVRVAAVPTMDFPSEFTELSASDPRLIPDFRRTSDARGLVRFNILPCNWDVLIVVESDRSRTTVRIDHGPAAALRSQRVTLSARGTTESLDSKSVALQLVGGIVVDANGQPIPDASIRGLFDASGTQLSVSSDEQGRFHAHAVAGGRTLVVDLPGGDSLWRSGRVTFECDTGDQHDLRIIGERLPIGVANVTIDVLDSESRKPYTIRHAQVFPRNRDDKTPKRISSEAVIVATGRKGQVQIDRARVGTWTIEVDTEEGLSTQSLDFDVKPGDTKLHFDLPIAIPATVKCRIVAHGFDGAEFAEILKQGWIVPLASDGVGHITPPWPMALEGRSDFELVSVPSSELRLRFEAPDALGEVQIDARNGGIITVDLEITRPATIHLRGLEYSLWSRRPSLHLVPVDAADEISRIHDQWIDLAPTRLQWKDRSESFEVLPGTFRYELFGDHYSGKYEFAQLDPPLLASGTITLAAGTTAEIDVSASGK